MTTVHKRPRHSAKRKARRVQVVESAFGPMSHMGFQGARHMHPERLPTRQREKAVSLRLFDLRQETVDNVQKLSDSIKRLMLPGLCLKTIPDVLVDKLVNLEKLDLSHNSLSDAGIPDAFMNLESLIELNLTDNKLTKVPSSVKKMKCLSRLDLSHNSLESLKGIEKARRLQILVLDHNKLSSVFKEISNLKKLEILRCSNNNIKDMDGEIRQLKFLKDLDISANKISVLPTDVFLLPSLEALNASHNKISKVPSFNVRVHNKHWVSDVDLSENDITNFPGHLLQISKKLDLSCNKIKTLDMKAMKHLENNSDQDLVLDENPLTFPPPDVSGLQSILHYLHEARLTATVYRGVKVLVLGAHKSGKSSLVHSLVDEQARLVDERFDSAGIETYEMKINYGEEGELGEYLELAIWDFCGHPFYLYPHYIFFEQPSISILTFNMKEYSAESFDEMIGSWFDWMIAKTNRLVVVLVGTHSDLVSKSRQRQIANDVKTRLDKFKVFHEKLIKERIAQIDQIPDIKPTHTDQMIALNKLLTCTETLTIQSEVIVTSAANYTGYDHLRDAIDTLAHQKKLFPDVLSRIPTFWVDVQNYVEEKGNTMVVPVMKWDDYFDEVTAKFGMKRIMTDITNYLHETGKVIWFSKHPVLSSYVFIRPSWLFEVLRCLYRHDQKEHLRFDMDESLKVLGYTVNRFERHKKQLLSEGIIETDFLKAILGQLLPVDDNQLYRQVEQILVDGFQIGYPVSRKAKETTYKLNIDPDSEGNITFTKILVPWLRKVSEPEDLIEEWESADSRQKLVALLKFPKYLPPGMFEILSVNIKHQKKEKEKVEELKYVAQWGGGFLSKHIDSNVLIKMHYKRGTDGLGTDLFIEIRDNNEKGEFADKVPAATMWNILYPMLLKFEEILKRYQGVLVERFMHCPECGEPSFLGEWNNPKETQSMETRPCEICKAEVDTSFLVQRREKTRDNVLENIAKVRLHRKTAMTHGSTLKEMLDDQQKEADDDVNIALAARPVEGRRRGGVLPVPDLSNLQALSHFKLPIGVPVENGEEDEEEEIEEKKEEEDVEDTGKLVEDDTLDGDLEEKLLLNYRRTRMKVPDISNGFGSDEEGIDADDEMEEVDNVKIIKSKSDGSTQTTL